MLIQALSQGLDIFSELAR